MDSLTETASHNIYITSSSILNNNGDIEIQEDGGAIINYGIINNSGKIDNKDFVGNYGTINNSGEINNEKTINNYGTINNSGGTITNNYYVGTIGTINNSGGTITNNDRIDNYGTIYNPASGLSCPEGTYNELGGVIYENPLNTGCPPQ